MYRPCVCATEREIRMKGSESHREEEGKAETARELAS